MTQIRHWQQTAISKISRCISSNRHELVSMPACVGSGKTLVMTAAYGEFILKHRNEKTVQVFVSPRIKLCSQQCDEIKAKLLELYGLNEGTDYRIIPIDCTQKDRFNRTSTTLENDTEHSIFVICDASLWGTDPDAKKANLNPDIRYIHWIQQFEAWESQGYKFGCICYDEAHNYIHEIDKMLPKEYY